jgi:diguanylate cyclase (GGDEF)-like protein/PAS domain S-box-containing protein
MANERILIVEDEKIIALDLRRRLERFGYEVVGLAAEADTAVELTGQERPDLVLMDIQLSHGSDGVAAATRIRDEYRIPVVFLTAFADEATIQRAKTAEPVGYVLKPFKEKELHTTIDIGLYKSRVERQLIRQERLFSSILRSAGDAIVSTDHTGVIQYINPAAETLTGWREEEAKGTMVDKVISLIKDSNGEPLSIGLATGSPIGGTRTFESISLLNKFGAKIHVEGSASDITGDRGRFEGLTIAFRDVTDVRKLNETVTYQASHDALTGLINREEFAFQLEGIATEGTRNHSEHVFLFVDIDQFKVINDVCGHQAGDELLRQISESIKSMLSHEYILGRLGGDQFGLVVLHADLDTGHRVAKELVAHLNHKFIWQNASYNVTVSIGAAPIGHGLREVNEILAAGDDACTLAKEHGGNSVRVFQSSDFVFLKRKGEMQWIARLTNALEEDRFVFFHQVIESLTKPGESKFEILLRLRDLDGSLVSPGEFIIAAERYKLMPSIDRWVIDGACQYVRHARDRDQALPVICVNLSGSSLADTTLLDYILFMFDKYEVEGSSFCLEVTETSAIQNFSHASNFISRIKETGATFALDDFGNGFSSFSYLKKLPVDYLKIDGSFVKDIEQDEADFAMVKAVNSIGHTLGMKTIAEYVHTLRIRELLQEIGVDYAQGFAVSEPAPLPYTEELSSIT